MKMKFPGLDDRIRKIRKKLGLSQTDFAKKLGLKSKMGVSHYENGTADPDISTVLKICKMGGVTENWLLYGNDVGYVADKRGQEVHESAEYNVGRYEVPVVSLIAAGITELGDEVDRAPKITLPYKEAKGCIAFQVTGDSMAPLYVEGDILIVKERGGEMPRDGFIYVVEWEEDTKVMRAVKYVHFASPGFLLTSKNRKHKAVKIDNIRRLFRIVFEITRFHEQLA